MARRSPNMRASQSSWKTGSLASGAIGPKPSMPPISCMPFIAFSRGRDPSGANHGIARNQRCEFGLAHLLGAGGRSGRTK
jgi:hypothetical protein